MAIDNTSYPTLVNQYRKNAGSFQMKVNAILDNDAFIIILSSYYDYQ